MSIKIKILYFPVLILAVNIFVTKTCYSQFFSMGTDPSRVRWRYIETPNYKVIYPEEIDSLAKRYTYLLEALKSPVLSSLNINPEKFDVVLHPYSTLSNGMVGVAPKRVEFITTPPANDNFIFNWEKHLVIHETRHTGHLSKFEHGIFKPAKWLTGEQATAIGTGVFMSRWKLEGDAVVSETELTSGGRGRDPDHLIYYKAAFLSGDYRNWSRWTMGSYENYVPDVYSFGYLFSSFVRFNSGNYNYLGDATDYLIKRFYDIDADNKGYKRYTGLTKKENFKKLKTVMTAKWERDDSLRAPFTRGCKIFAINEGYTNYSFPVEMEAGNIVVLKSDLNRGKRLVMIDKTGDERVLRHMGRVNSSIIRSGEKIYWTEHIQSPRWELESFSELFSYDLKRGKTVRESKFDRSFNPVISQKGDTLITVFYPVSGSSFLKVFINDFSKPVKEIEAPGKGQIKESAIVDGNIYITSASDSGLAMYRYDASGEKWIEEIPAQKVAISNLKSRKGELLFISSIDGVSNIYSYNVLNKDLRQLTNSRFGIGTFGLSEDGEYIYYTDFDRNGYDLRKDKYNSMLWKPALFTKIKKDDFATILSQSAGLNADTLFVPEKPLFNSKPYRKGLNIIKIHSWAPIYYNIDAIKSLSYESIYSAVKPGVILFSQNSLGTANIITGYSWKKGFHSGHLKMIYRGLFPVIEYSANINERNKYQYTVVNDQNSGRYQKKDTIMGSPFFGSQLTLYAPLDYSKGGWSSGIIPSLFWRYTNDSFYSYENSRFSSFQSIKLGISCYRILNMAVRDIFPSRGVGLNLQFTAVPFSGENFGSLIYSSVYSYLPLPFNNHGLKITAAYQKQFSEGKNYLMPGAMTFPDGYETRYSRWAYSLSAEYAFPLIVRDISLTPIFYLKRVYAIPFIHYCRNSGEKSMESLASFGSDILLDVNLLGISYPLTIGLRGGYNLEKNTFVEFLFKTPL
ncbi:MAG: hypothetical protein AB9922_06815 [Bacteroidales bacterium]